jgi:uncharacterized membrane protein YphA (DoxX/SURF4 family)
MKLYQKLRDWLKEGEFFLDIVRIYLGIGLFVKAIYFIYNQETLHGLVESAGEFWGITVLISHYVILAHIAGGAMLALGLLTRIAAAVQIPALLGAVFLVHFPNLLSEAGGDAEFELAALALLLLLIFSISGAGKLSVDAYLKTHDD